MRRFSRRFSHGVVCLLVLACVLAVSGTALAAPKAGCPVGEGWAEPTVEVAAEAIWDELVDQSPWVDLNDFQESAIRPYDRNGDGSICLKTQWGDDRNPNSNWFGVFQFLPRDNTSNANN